jgi:RNA polymerase sigma-70 factor (ECF subfamily)
MASSNSPKLNGPWQGDVALAERCRAHEPGAFEELYRTHASKLFGLACRMVGPGEAEDLLQEIFLTAHRKLALYRGQSAIGTWLFRLSTNLCLDHLRSRNARFDRLTDSVEDRPVPAGAGAGAVLGIVDRLDLERALRALPEGYRAVFVLHDVEGREHREIGKLLGISDGTSKSQLHKARMRLRKILSADRESAAVHKR